MHSRDNYVPFLIMICLVAPYALFWAIFVMDANPFTPVSVEEVLEKESRRNFIARFE